MTHFEINSHHLDVMVYLFIQKMVLKYELLKEYGSFFGLSLSIWKAQPWTIATRCDFEENVVGFIGSTRKACHKQRLSRLKATLRHGSAGSVVQPLPCMDEKVGKFLIW